MAKKAAPPRRKQSRQVPELHSLLRAHFGTDPSQLPVLEQEFDEYHRPDLHLALEELVPGDR